MSGKITTLEQLAQCSGPATLSNDLQPPPPPYSENSKNLSLPDGSWDAVLNTDKSQGCLFLDTDGRPIWHKKPEFKSSDEYWRDGFHVCLTKDKVTISDGIRTWSCLSGPAAQLLRNHGDKLALQRHQKRLIVFELTPVNKNHSLRPEPSRQDEEGDLKVETEPTDVWSITGTDIHQVLCFKDDVLVRSPNYHRLWDMQKGKFRWEKFRPGFRILAVVPGFVVVDGLWHLVFNVKNGWYHGKFMIPQFGDFISFGGRHECDPQVTKDGLVIHKTAEKAVYLFHLKDKRVIIRIWESEDPVTGPLLIRGTVEKPELWMAGCRELELHKVDDERIYEAGLIEQWFKY